MLQEVVKRTGGVLPSALSYSLARLFLAVPRDPRSQAEITKLDVLFLQYENVSDKRF